MATCAVTIPPSPAAMIEALSNSHVAPSTIFGSTFSPSSAPLIAISDNSFPSLFKDTCSDPLLTSVFSLDTAFVAPSTPNFNDSSNVSYADCFRASSELSKIVSFPFRLSCIVSAIAFAFPSQLFSASA